MNSTKREISKVVTLVVAMVALTGLFLESRLNPVHGQSLTITGPMPGVVFLYNSSGAPMNAYSCTLLTGTSTTSGTFSLTGTGPIYNGVQQWTTPASAWVDNVSITSAGTAIGQAYTPYPVSLSVSSNTITATGTVYSPTTLIVLGATAVNATTSKSIVMRVCSN